MVHKLVYHVPNSLKVHSTIRITVYCIYIQHGKYRFYENVEMDEGTSFYN